MWPEPADQIRRGGAEDPLGPSELAVRSGDDRPESRHHSHFQWPSLGEASLTELCSHLTGD